MHIYLGKLISCVQSGLPRLVLRILQASLICNNYVKRKGELSVKCEQSVKCKLLFLITSRCLEMSLRNKGELSLP